MLADGEPAAAAEQEALRLMKALGVQLSQLVDVAYVDLLAQRRGGTLRDDGD